MITTEGGNFFQPPFLANAYLLDKQNFEGSGKNLQLVQKLSVKTTFLEKKGGV